MRQRIETQTVQRVPSPPPAEERPAGQLPMATPMPRQELRPVPVRDVAVKMYPIKIAKSILAITRAMQPVEKAGFNKFHGYKYPKWEDILEQLGPLIAEHGLIIIQSETSHGGFERDLIEISYEFTIVNEDGDVWPDRPTITSICKVRDQKGIIDDKAASKCHTQAHKYALVQLFKIRTADLVEHDANEPNRGGPQQQQRRPVPSPSGKVAPHYLQGVEGETAQTWAEKFIALVTKADTIEELNDWDHFNGKLLDLCKERDVPTFNKIVDTMNARERAITAKAPAETKQPAPVTNGGGFPGDKPAAASPAQASTTSDQIPIALDRKLTDRDREWLMSLAEAFTQCNSIEEIGSEQDSLMMPSQGTVPAHAWNRACDLVDQHIERVQKGGN